MDCLRNVVYFPQLLRRAGVETPSPGPHSVPRVSPGPPTAKQCDERSRAPTPTERTIRIPGNNIHSMFRDHGEAWLPEYSGLLRVPHTLVHARVLSTRGLRDTRLQDP